MDWDLSVSIEEEVNNVVVRRPHVVILGAGASRATCPEGDRTGQRLPLMRDLATVLKLEPLLKEWGVAGQTNFEDVFSDLFEKRALAKIEQLQASVERYFGRIEIPSHPTIYDNLVLSLRSQDLIATFNWDPLLLQAYRRNVATGLSLPKLAFLHGNVSVGYCIKDRVVGPSNVPCLKCGIRLTQSGLLYPIRNKNYASNEFIANEWHQLKRGLSNAFMITVFGYSSPKSDQEAIAAMEEAWGDPKTREMEQTEIIISPSGSENDARQNWDRFIHTHHYDVHKSFWGSWIANHPRRTGEAWFQQYFEARFVTNNPAPQGVNLDDLRKWFMQFKAAEERSTSP